MKERSLKFDINGYLSSGFIKMDVELMKVNFVDTFPKSTTRAYLFDNYLRYIQKLSQEVYPYFEQWIDGSFITQKRNPKDIDLVTFLDYRIYELRGEPFMDKFWSFSLESEGLDAYIVKQYPENHALYPKFIEVREYYFNLFSMDRTDRPKGIIQLNFSK